MPRFASEIGHAWLSMTFTFPMGWRVAVPTGRSEWRNVPVDSLDDALRVAAEHDIVLDVDDWTYEQMVAAGVAPADRPESARQPVEDDDDGGRMGAGTRAAMYALAQRGADYMGLTEDAAYARADEQGIEVEVLRPGDAIAASYCPSRLRLRLTDGRVSSASVG